MIVLTQFVFRLSFGLALAMAVTSPRLVSSGYFRVHLYVLMGLNVLASAVAWLNPEQFPLGPPLAAAAVSYVGSVFWLYEKPRAGRAALWAVAAIALAGAWLTQDNVAGLPWHVASLARLDPLGGGLVLGATMAAMLLGHWYLNTPEMKLGPLRRLVRVMAAALVFRAALCAAGFALLMASEQPATAELLFIALRWLSGLAAALLLAWMTWQTLRIPNTQSATGILYVAVIVTFVGELTGQLVSRGYPYPL